MPKVKEIELLNINNVNDVKTYLQYKTDGKVGEEYLKLLTDLYNEMGVEMVKMKVEKMSALEGNIKLVEKSNSVLQQFNDMKSKKEKLENLCRDLSNKYKEFVNKHNEDVAQQELQRNQMKEQFDKSIADITARMKQDQHERTEQQKAGQDLHDKVQKLLKEYGKKEQEFNKKLNASNKEVDSHRNKLKQQLLLNKELAEALQKREAELAASLQREELMKKEIAMYSEKFESVSDFVTKHKETVTLYQDEMKKLTELNKQLITDIEFMKQRQAKTDALLIEQEQIKRNLQKEKNDANDKKVKLENLCRTLQTERISLLAKIKTFESTSAGDNEPNDVTESKENTPASTKEGGDNKSISVADESTKDIPPATNDSSNQTVESSTENTEGGETEGDNKQ